MSCGSLGCCPWWEPDFAMVPLSLLTPQNTSSTAKPKDRHSAPALRCPLLDRPRWWERKSVWFSGGVANRHCASNSRSRPANPGSDRRFSCPERKQASVCHGEPQANDGKPDPGIKLHSFTKKQRAKPNGERWDEQCDKQ